MSSHTSLDELVASALDRLEEGGNRALEAFLAEHPTESAVIRRCLATLNGVGLLGLEDGAESAIPERLGEFRLIESLGAGGMGVVFRAVQEPLGREVALKIIRPEQLYFEGARERFKREVEIVARLQHPGIVAVHAVGEQSGVPYFAMELIRGKTLETILAGLAGRAPETLVGRDLDPSGAGSGYLFEGSWEETCLRVVKQVCDALEFAHSNGVLHRDLKPSNIMISAEGSPRAMLLDFGLAIGNRDAQRLTRTGSQLGSLRYMASEQVRGNSALIGPRTDVYGLGITLYEMLCNAPAFAGRSDAELVVAIERGELPPLRSRSASASWEAETICAAATDPEPHRRYASVSDLGRDVGNALAHRPIEARRAGAWLRAKRWSQRHPAEATALLLGSLVLVGGPSSYAWLQWRSSRAMQAQLLRTERVADLAVESVDRLLSRLGGEDLSDVPQLEPVRRAALEDAVELTEKLILEHRDDPRVRSSASSAHARLGRLLAELGRPAEASEALSRAVAQLESSARRSGGDAELANELTGLRVEQAVTLHQAGRAPEAREILEAVRASLPAGAGDLRAEELRARAGVALGELLSSLDELAEARRLLSESAQAFDRILEARPDAVDVGVRALEAWNEYGLLLSTRFTGADGTVDPETLPSMQRALALAERLCAAHPSVTRYRYRAATARGNLGGVYRRLERYEDAIDCYERSRAELEPVVRDFPSTLSYKLELATQRNQLGLVHATVAYEHRKAGRLEEERPCNELAAPHYRATMELLEEITRDAPGNATYLHRLSIARYNVAAMMHALDPGSPEELEVIEGAVHAAEEAHEVSPDNEDILRTLVVSYGARINAYLRRDDHARAAALIGDVPRVQPERPESYSRAAVWYARCVAVAREQVEPDDAAGLAAIESYAERGAEMARAAVEHGIPNPAGLGAVADLAPLRGTPAFDRLVEELGAGSAAGGAAGD